MSTPGLLSLIFFGVAALAFTFSAGVKLERRRHMAMARPPLRAVCDCEHLRNKHDDNGKCLEDVRRKIDSYTFKWVQCKCVRYSGPMSVLELVRPPLMLPDDYPQDRDLR